MRLTHFMITSLQGTFLFLFALIAIAAFVLAVFDLKKYLNGNVDVKDIWGKAGKNILAKGVIFVLSSLATMLTLAMASGNGSMGGLVLVIIGGLVFFMSIATFLLSFVVHFYKFKPVNYLVRKSFLVVIFSGIIALITIFLLLDGFVYLDIITFPLMNKIYFNKANDTGIAFYALFILAGALVSYFLSDHEIYKKYKRHGLLENVFYVAFPAGIIGARIWYVIGEWHTFKDDLIRIFYIWEGGLAIMGGALLGIIVGVLFVKFKRKEISLLYTVDVVIPTILLAQAIGRWGNFFNQEVYGFKLANMDGYFFLPEFIKRNMFIEGSYRVPLFFFEGVVNVLGFFVLRYGIGEGLKKWKLPLDIAFGYATWYGLTRVVMEPLRDPLYNMGQNGSWSYIWGIVFAVAGILAIVINHLIHHFAKNKKVVAK
jgi:prolipoprotein diacylglyceryl transferase